MVDVLSCGPPTELWESVWEDISVYPSLPAIVDTAIRVGVYSFFNHLKIYRRSCYHRLLKYKGYRDPFIRKWSMHDTLSVKHSKHKRHKITNLKRFRIHVRILVHGQFVEIIIKLYMSLFIFQLFYYLFTYLAAPRGMWDLCSPTRDQTCTHCIGNTES